MTARVFSRHHSHRRAAGRGPGRLAKSLVAGLAGLGLVGVVAGPLAPAALAESGRFELTGPDLRITVTRAGKELPLGAVPSLAEGDILHIAASLPGDQSAHLMVVSAFLRGATNPPPREWIGVARTWRDKPAEQTLTLTVPKGARQMVVLVVPDTRGAQGALVDAVRGKPGEFVRASQDLNQASLDHARLDAFIAAVRADSIAHPQGLRKIAPVLAHSLSIKLNEDCLDKIAEQQASCLVENREALVLNDVHTSSLTETLAGAPTDLALTVSATAAAGAGLYSPYIGVVRDLARVLGAFSNPQFSYLPTLAVVNGPVASLRLNTAPSFSKPKSVMVMAMPAIGADSPPQLRSTAPGPLCARSGPLVLPVEGAPLIFATGYAHDMSARLTAPEGKQSELDVTPSAEHGGYLVTSEHLPQNVGTVRLHLHGRWGFDAFEGPDFLVQRADDGPWSRSAPVGSTNPAEAGGPLVAGRDNTVTLAGPSPGCVEDVSLRLGNGPARPVAWHATDEGHVSVTVPLAEGETGDVRLEVREQGIASPATVALRARAESSRIDSVEIHAGDNEAVVTGQRLEQVLGVSLGDIDFRPDGLTRQGRTDRLHLTAQTTAGQSATGQGTTGQSGGPQGSGGKPGPAAKASRVGEAGTMVKVVVRLEDGRNQGVTVRIAPPRPRIDMISRTVNPAAIVPGTRLLKLSGDDLLPEDGELVFSVKAGPGTTLDPDDAIEVARAGSQSGLRLTSGKGLMMVDGQVVVATLRAADLPPGSFGPLRYRLVQAPGTPVGGNAGNGEQVGAWQPLATLARLPRITGFSCDGATSLPCTLSGRNLFLLDAVAADADFTRAITVQPGFTGSSLRVPRPVDGTLHLRLRDAPQARVGLAIN